MKEIEKFYPDLYAGDDDTVYENHLFVQGTEIPKLSDDMRNICELRKVVGQGVRLKAEADYTYRDLDYRISQKPNRNYCFIIHCFMENIQKTTV